MLTAYVIKQQDLNQVSFYFADRVGGDSALFVQEVLRQLATLNRGVELGGKIFITDELTINTAAAIGRHQHANSPNLFLYTEPSITAGSAGFTGGMLDYGVANLKGYHLGTGPQQAYSLGFQYNDPSYWRIGLTGNFFSHGYLQVNPLRRSSAFLLDATGQLIQGVDPIRYQQIIRQEEFPSYFTLNAIGSKSWKVKHHYFGFFVSIQNLLNKDFITGGFEQGRNANYTEALQDVERATPLFSPKYWWGRGTTFFTSIYYRF